MRQRFGIHQYSLTVQLILSFVFLVVLTAAAAGIPAIWLVHNQIERQAWEQVNQATQATQALYQALLGQLDDLALLTAQRPTLLRLLYESQPAVLADYLQTLQRGAELDLILVCDRNGRPIAYAGLYTTAALCQPSATPEWQVIQTEAAADLWLLAQEPVTDEGEPLAQVVVGVQVNNAFATRLQAQTGLVHLYLLDDAWLSGSLTMLPTDWQSVPVTKVPDTSLLPSLGEMESPAFTAVSFQLYGRLYYATRLSLNQTGLVDQIALEVSQIVATEKRIIGAIAGSFAGVALLASLLGAWIARQIGRPLAQLATAAASIRVGTLDTSLAVPSSVWEVSLVTEALEAARLDLQHSLHDLQRAKAWTDHLLEAIVEGIVTLDRYGRITFFSPGASRITGLLPAEVIGRSCNQVFHPAESSQPFSEFIPPPGGQRKVVLQLTGERLVTMAITGARLAPPDADDAGVALVFRDVSEADMIHRLLGHFLANITHEFRTPLSALAASTELLLDQAADLSPAELHHLLNSLHLGIVGLQTLVDNLLESASQEAGRFRIYPRPYDLAEIIAEATHIMQPLLDKYGQWLVVELPTRMPQVRADPRRMVQVVVNLLSNAVKYSPDETEIKIGVVVLPNSVRVTVADRGPGVPPGYRPELFRRFTRPGNSDSKSQYGAGLGLSVVKAIVAAHGGQVEVEDRKGGGSVFWFTLPIEVGTTNGAD